MISVKEHISVIVIFNEKTKMIMPRTIKWKERNYTITKIGFHYKEQRGRVLFHIFSVASSTVYMKVSLDTESLRWKLEELYDTAY